MFDWVQDVLNYIQCLFDTAMVFSVDVVIKLTRMLVEAFATLLGLIPVPSEIAGGLSSMTSGLDSSITYFMIHTGVPQALAILGAGALFRLTRKLITLGQW